MNVTKKHSDINICMIEVKGALRIIPLYTKQFRETWIHTKKKKTG